MTTEAAALFQAFTLETVVQQSPRKVDSLCAWAGYVLAGLNDGSLLVYKRQESAAEDNLKWQVRENGTLIMQTCRNRVDRQIYDYSVLHASC